MKLLLVLAACQLVALSYGLNVYSAGEVEYIENLDLQLSEAYGAPKKQLSPVILVPGAGGSRLDAMLDKPKVVNALCERKTDRFYNIWFNKMQMMPWAIDCWADNLRLEYDRTTRKTVNSPGVSISVPGWGFAETVEWNDPAHSMFTGYFVNVVNALVQLGYRREVSIRGAPYDFRKAPFEDELFPIKLKQLVEDTYNTNNNTAITFIVHSLGGPKILHFLQRQSQEWKDQYVQRVISLSAAWGGDASSLKTLTVGEDAGIFIIKSKTVKTMFGSTSSMARLMPSPLFWKEDEVLAKSDKRIFTVKDYQAFYETIGFSDGWEMYKDALPYIMNFTAPGVEVYCYYGSDVKTLETLDFGWSWDLSGTPKIKFGPGDGLINKRSLEACKVWGDEQKQPIHTKAYPSVNHMTILSNRNVLRDVAQLAASG